MSETSLCPCGSPLPYASCCEKVHSDLGAAETAEQLMRARYTAFTKLMLDFLYDSFHPSTRKQQSKADILQWARENKWMQLEIVCSTETSVEFRAHYLNPLLELEIHHEKSTFKRLSGHWHYVDGRIMR